MSDERCSSSGGILLAFLAGGLVGAGIALLYAPVSGREARERIDRGVRAALDAAPQLPVRTPDVVFFDLLGLFQGVGLPFQSESAPVQMPNMVWLYRVPILLYWAEHDETLGHIITHVLVHEIGHHFGLSDDDMDAIEKAAG